MLDTVALRLFQFALFALAVFVPFSIAGTNIALGFCALAWLIATVAGRNPDSRFAGRMSVREDPMLIASIVLVLSAIPAVLMSEDIGRAIKDFKSYWQLLIYFMMATCVGATRMRGVFMWVLLSSATISCMVAFIQRAGGLHLGFINIAGSDRASSTMFTITFAGILYQLIVFYAASAMASARQLRERLAFAAGAVVQFVAILLTMTRGAWIGLAAGATALLALLRSRIAFAAAVLALAAMIGFGAVYSRNQGRNMSITAFFHKADFTVATRLVLWDVAWELFRKHPVFGVGMGDFTIEANKILRGRSVTTTVDAHNIALDILSTRGLFGFIPFVYFWIALFRTLGRARRACGDGSRGRAAAIGATAAAVALLAGSATELAMNDSEVFMAFMVIVGMASSYLYRGEADGSTT